MSATRIDKELREELNNQIRYLTIKLTTAQYMEGNRVPEGFAKYEAEAEKAIIDLFNKRQHHLLDELMEYEMTLFNRNDTLIHAVPVSFIEKLKEELK